MSFLGVSYASYSVGLYVEENIQTGNIDPVFSKCSVEYSNGLGNASVVTVGKDKKLKIDFSNVKPGYKARIKYRIINKGTVPVRCWVDTTEFNKQGITTYCDTSEIQIDVNQPENVIVPNEIKDSKKTLPNENDSVEGVLDITVGNVDELADYDFTAELKFKQWNAVDEE